jgi:hypothetical protein
MTSQSRPKCKEVRQIHLLPTSDSAELSTGCVRRTILAPEVHSQHIERPGTYLNWIGDVRRSVEQGYAVYRCKKKSTHVDRAPAPMNLTG